MKPTRGFQHLFSFLCILGLILSASACLKTPREDNPPSAAPEQAYKGPAWPALALLKTGENPIWFEFGPDGPELVESPSAASLTPFAPWPHARFVTGMRFWQDYLVMAVNRFGFLVLGSGAEGFAGESAQTQTTDAGSGEIESADVFLYRSADSALWDPYTAGSFFTWEDKPAVLLYRNDFFSEPAAHPPQSPVYVLDRSSAVPLAAAVPALEALPADGSREAEALRRGSDGFWYYRVREKGSAENETLYFRAEDLAAEGSGISAGEWRNSGKAEAPELAPPLLAALLARTEEFGLGRVSAVRAISPDFEGERFFSAGGGEFPDAAPEGEDPLSASAYSRETPEPLALVVLPDGRGLFSRSTKSEPEDARVQALSLPALGENFAYSGVALLGEVLTASWEEQQDAGIGAAGFMALSLDGILP